MKAPSGDGDTRVAVTEHWVARDIGQEILSAAWQPELPPPTVIHVRPELHALLRDRVAAVEGAGSDGGAAGVRLVVDAEIPSIPGYEIHRRPAA